MSDYIGTREQVDEYIGSRLVEAAYLGSRKYYDAYSEITGLLPIIFKSRAAVALKNYRIHGTASGAGVETENLFDKDAKDTTNGYKSGYYIASDGSVYADSSWDTTEYIPCTSQTSYCFSKCVGMAASICWYDSNKSFISGSAIRSPSGFKNVVLESPENASYVRTCVLLEHVKAGTIAYDRNVEVFMITSGSTTPDHYIPYGYSIPLTDTGENLFDYSARDTEKGFVSGVRLASDGTYDPVSNWGISEYIAASEDSNYVWRWTDSAEPVQVIASVGFYNSAKTFISGIAYNRRGVIPFTTPANTEYIRVSFLLSEGLTLFNCVLVRGFVAPASYIPYRSSTYPLYIGDSKLGAEEYLDYQEQKIYKRTENLFEVYSDNAGHTTFETGGLTGVINRSEQSITVNKTSTARYPQVQLIGSQGVLRLVPNKTYTVSIASSNAPENAYVYILIQGYINGGWETIKSTRGIATDTFSFTENYANYRYILVMEGTGLTYNNTKIRISIVEGEVSSFIPYLNPTDPPVSLPAILTHQGENTLSSTETLGEATIKGRINELPTTP